MFLRILSLLLVATVSACVSENASTKPAVTESKRDPTSTIELSYLAPSAGTASTQVVAYGRFEHQITQQVKVLFADEWVVPRFVDETRIEFVAPERPSGIYEVKVNVGSLTSDAIPFALESQIEKVSPILIGTEKLLRLSGSGMTKAGQVEVGSLLLPVLFAGDTTAVTRWPSELRPGQYPLRFVSGDVYSVATTLELSPQILYILPENAYGGDTAVAYGANFPEGFDSIYRGYDRVYGEVTVPVGASTVTTVTFSIPVTAPPGVVFRWSDNSSVWHAFKIWPAFDSVTPATAITSETITVRGRNLGWAITSFIPEDFSASISLGGQKWPCPCMWYPTVVTLTVPSSFSSGEASLFLHPFEPYFAEPDLRGVYAVTTVTVAP